jgi:hypothetical protein
MISSSSAIAGVAERAGEACCAVTTFGHVAIKANAEAHGISLEIPVIFPPNSVRALTVRFIALKPQAAVARGSYYIHLALNQISMRAGVA